MLDLARPGVHEPAVIDDYMRPRDEPPNRGRPANPSVFADPQQGGDEGHGVGREMAAERAAREFVVAEAPRLVLRLPVRLKQDVTLDVGDQKRQQSCGPTHRRSAATTPAVDPATTGAGGSVSAL